MTVLRGAYITCNPRVPLFGRALVAVLECQNYPMVEDVLGSSPYSMTDWVLRHSGTTQVPTAERLLVE
ncbi:hypothetical protein GCM10010220_48640 [Streptomyces parvulus]|nr:hypothetical protein GCM10010220_48640 [Streptomyces parvulus]